jgi:type IV secretion system protein VirD4
VAALVDRVFEVAGLAATARGGRVDPPITVMLDEAANVCRIDALPDLYSFFGSQGISVTTILQSYKQGMRVWGIDGMDALWSAATVAIAGAGLKDIEFGKTLSDLVGQHEVDKRSHSTSNTGSSQSTSTHWEPILRPEEVAALPKTKALLFSSGASPVTLTLKPWYAERDADQITDDNQTATGEVTAAAVAYLGPHNALAQALRRTEPIEAPSL